MPEPTTTDDTDHEPLRDRLRALLRDAALPPEELDTLVQEVRDEIQADQQPHRVGLLQLAFAPDTDPEAARATLDDAAAKLSEIWGLQVRGLRKVRPVEDQPGRPLLVDSRPDPLRVRVRVLTKASATGGLLEEVGILPLEVVDVPTLVSGSPQSTAWSYVRKFAAIAGHYYPIDGTVTGS